MSWYTEEVKGVLDIAKTLATLGTLGLVVRGWHIISTDNNRREHRKETWGRVQRLCTDVCQLREDAVTYWTTVRSALGTQSDSASLKSKLKSISHSCALLHEIDSRFDVTSEVVALRQAVTGGDFESKGACQATDEKTGEIFLAVDNLNAALDRGFREAHPAVDMRISDLV